MSRYAEKTTVSSEKSRAEIERILSRYGASGFMYGWNQGTAVIAFEMHDRRVQFRLPLPDRSEFRYTEVRRALRDDNAIDAAHEQSVRQRWRALALVIKAKLEAVEAGITVFEEEFLAHIMLPNGGTVGDFMIPQVNQAYLSGEMPPLLPSPDHS